MISTNASTTKNDDIDEDAHRRLWCRVWFRALHLGGGGSSPSAAAGASTTTAAAAVADGTARPIDGTETGTDRGDHHHGASRRGWTSDDLARLETVLAMDDMERRSGGCGSGSGSSNSNSSNNNNSRIDDEGTSYVASRA